MKRAFIVVAAWLVASAAQAQASRTSAAPAGVPSLQLITAVASQPDLCVGVDSIGVGTIAVAATFNLVKVDAVCTRIRRVKGAPGPRLIRRCGAADV